MKNPSGFKPQVGTADVLMITRIGTQEFSMTENKRSNLQADRKDNGTWRCHITHVETTSESGVHLRVENCWIFLTLTCRKIQSGLRGTTAVTQRREAHSRKSTATLAHRQSRIICAGFPVGSLATSSKVKQAYMTIYPA